MPAELRWRSVGNLPFYGAQERPLPTIAAAASDPGGQRSQCGTLLVDGDAAAVDPPVPVLLVPKPFAAGAIAGDAAAPMLDSDPAPLPLLLGAVARIPGDEADAVEPLNVA